MRRHIDLACFALCASGVLVPSFAPASNAEAPAATQNRSGDTGKEPSDVPLSKKRDANAGVLKPPPGIDPGMHQQPPANTGDKMPVIVPPGEPGGDQSIQPK